MSVNMDMETIQKLVASMNVSEGTSSGGSAGKKIHTFNSKVGDLNVFYQLTSLGSASFLWVGGPDGRCHDLSLSSPTRYDKNGMPATTQIFGDMGNMESGSLAAKLAKKLNKPFYVSFNLLGSDLRLLREIESRIFEEITVNPEKF